MSSFERHLRRQAQRSRVVAARDLSVEELAEAERVVNDLTDQAARAIFEEDDDDLERVVNDKLHEVAERFGGAGVLIGFTSAAVSSLAHMLSHEMVLDDLDEHLAGISSLHRGPRHIAASSFVDALVAEAAGRAGRSAAAVEALVEELHEEAGPVVTGVWQAVVALGGELGVGARWCSDGEPEDAGEPGDGSVEDAREVAGVAAAVVDLFGSGRNVVARAALTSLVDQVLPVDGLLSALAVLELGTEADADMVRAACARGVADAAAWEYDEEPDEMLVERVAARFEVVARSMAGAEALVLLRSRLEDASRAEARAPIGPRYVATRLVTPRVSPERTAR